MEYCAECKEGCKDTGGSNGWIIVVVIFRHCVKERATERIDHFGCEEVWNVMKQRFFHGRELLSLYTIKFIFLPLMSSSIDALSTYVEAVNTGGIVAYSTSYTKPIWDIYVR